MPESLYIPGEIARISIRVTDITGTAADPGTLTLKIKPPTGPTATYVYGSAAEIVRDSLGNYHADIVMSTSGQWAYRWETTAPNGGAAEGAIVVKKSRVI